MLYLGDMWFGVATKMDVEKTYMCVLQDIGLNVQNMLTILCSTINVIGVGGCT